MASMAPPVRAWPEVHPEAIRLAKPESTPPDKASVMRKPRGAVRPGAARSLHTRRQSQPVELILLSFRAMNEKLLMSALSAKRTSSKDYRIGPDDLIEVNVFEDENDPRSCSSFTVIGFFAFFSFTVLICLFLFFPLMNPRFYSFF